MRKITDDEFEYLLGLVTKEVLDLLTPEQVIECRERVDIFLEDNPNLDIPVIATQ